MQETQLEFEISVARAVINSKTDQTPMNAK